MIPDKGNIQIKRSDQFAFKRGFKVVGVTAGRFIAPYRIVFEDEVEPAG
jgi:hypothetical protein